MTTLHAVIETASRDCDGLYTGGFTLNMTEAEKTEDFGDINFHERVTARIVNTYSCEFGGTLTVTKGDEEGGWTRLRWHEVTDEGFRSVEALIEPAEADDEPEDHWQRDHAAEAMGY